MFCSNCGKENSNESRFCFSCGRPLVDQAILVGNKPNLNSSAPVECPACHIGTLEADGSENTSTPVKAFRVGGILLDLLGVATVIFALFQTDTVDKISMLLAGAVLVGAGVWVMKIANAYKGYLCRSCGSSILMDVAGVYHIASKNEIGTSKNILIVAVVTLFIVLGFGYKSTLNDAVDRKPFSSDGSYSYEPSIVSLDGVLVTPKGEAPNGRFVQYYAVELTSPIKVNGDKSDPINYDTIHDVRIIQLTGDSSVINQIKSNKGRKVNLKGTLFHSHSGHHFTTVLMTVQSVNLN
jgi:hypothetical protein